MNGHRDSGCCGGRGILREAVAARRGRVRNHGQVEQAASMVVRLGRPTKASADSSVLHHMLSLPLELGIVGHTQEVVIISATPTVGWFSYVCCATLMRCTHPRQSVSHPISHLQRHRPPPTIDDWKRPVPRYVSGWPGLAWPGTLAKDQKASRKPKDDILRSSFLISDVCHLAQKTKKRNEQSCHKLHSGL